MKTWINASEEDLRQFQIIKIALANKPRFLGYLFQSDKACLRFSVDEVPELLRGLSTGEQTLLRVALDIWGGYGGASLIDILTTLDPINRRNVFQALERLHSNE